MPTSRRPDSVLELGGVALVDLVSDARIGTPAYVYDLDGMVAEARALRAAFEGAPHHVSYAMKANAAGPIVKALAAEGCGADVVSGAELLLALRCGIAADDIVYSGVAKTDEELDLAIGSGERGIFAIQAESVEEIPRVAARARALGRVARVSLRLNPGLDADSLDTHRHIATGHDEAKFGIPLASVPAALDAVTAAAGAVSLVGLTTHVGSQVTATDSYLASARVLFRVARETRARFPLVFVDTGGGFGIDYGAGCPVKPADFIRETRALQRAEGLGDLVLGCEPGRSLVAASGVLLAKVIQRKVAEPRRWLMIDAGMNDLMRPALYQARHRIVPLATSAGTGTRDWKVVGPVCESSDDFGVHALPDAGFDHVAILDAGAYGYSMASRYNGRQLPAEVFLRGGKVASVHARQATSAWVEDRLAAG